MTTDIRIRFDGLNTFLENETMAKYLSNVSLGYNISKEKTSFPIFQSQQTQNSLLPSILINYSFSNCRTELPVNGKIMKVYLPKIDQILTDYASEAASVYSTISFIELANKLIVNNFNAIFLADTKLEYAITLYSNLYQVSAVTAEVRTVLSAYFSNSTENLLLQGGSFFTRLTPVEHLKQSLTAIENKYLSRLKNEVNLESVKFFEPTPYQDNPLVAPRKAEFTDQPTKQWIATHKSDKVLTDNSAQGFINIANSEILNDINVEFETNRAKALGLAANIISDPRFKMSLEDPRWNKYDETIKKEVALYNQKFNGVAGFVPLDWRYVKAMVWTEVMAGPAGNSKEWQARPMQIGIPGDPGLSVLAKGGENTDLMTTPEFRNKLQNLTEWDGETNIKAGIAWLFRKAYGDKVSWNENVVDDPRILTYVLDKQGFKGIEAKLNSTIKNIEINNPGINFRNSNPGDEIKYQKAHKERYISSWTDWRTAIFDYNGKGDSVYMDKIDKAYQIIVSRNK